MKQRVKSFISVGLLRRFFAVILVVLMFSSDSLHVFAATHSHSEDCYCYEKHFHTINHLDCLTKSGTCYSVVSLGSSSTMTCASCKGNKTTDCAACKGEGVSGWTGSPCTGTIYQYTEYSGSGYSGTDADGNYVSGSGTDVSNIPGFTGSVGGGASGYYRCNKCNHNWGNWSSSWGGSYTDGNYNYDGGSSSYDSTREPKYDEFGLRVNKSSGTCGLRTPIRCTSCYNSSTGSYPKGIGRVTCAACNGSGKSVATCPNCKGSGCSTCSYKGQVGFKLTCTKIEGGRYNGNTEVGKVVGCDKCVTRITLRK